MTSIPPCSLRTERLTLRPTSGADADRAFAILSDWDVTRMLRMASFPPDRQELLRWFADHPRQWRAGEAYRFAVELEGEMIGLADIDRIERREGSLGYWLERSIWRRGYGLEAARAVTAFAQTDAGLLKPNAGHADDNAGSARVLSKLGFRPTGAIGLFSRPRGRTIVNRRYILQFPQA